MRIRRECQVGAKGGEEGCLSIPSVETLNGDILRGPSAGVVRGKLQKFRKSWSGCRNVGETITRKTLRYNNKCRC